MTGGPSREDAQEELCLCFLPHVLGGLCVYDACHVEAIFRFQSQTFAVAKKTKKCLSFHGRTLLLLIEARLKGP